MIVDDTPTQEKPDFEFDFEFGKGGVLDVLPDDPNTLVIQFPESQSEAPSSFKFQLSLVPSTPPSPTSNTLSSTQALFSRYIVDFERFIADESILHDPRLVVRWGGEDSDQYVRREDGSAVFGGLEGWRRGVVERRERVGGVEGKEDRMKSKRTASSWVQWWRSKGDQVYFDF